MPLQVLLPLQAQAQVLAAGREEQPQVPQVL
jgi:hypothetical protein